MPERRTVRHPVSPVPEWTKKLMPEPVPYRNNGDPVRYRNDPVTDWDTGCRNKNDDAGGIGVDRCPAMHKINIIIYEVYKGQHPVWIAQSLFKKVVKIPDLLYVRQTEY